MYPTRLKSNFLQPNHLIPPKRRHDRARRASSYKHCASQIQRGPFVYQSMYGFTLNSLIPSPRHTTPALALLRRRRKLVLLGDDLVICRDNKGICEGDDARYQDGGGDVELEGERFCVFCRQLAGWVILLDLGSYGCRRRRRWQWHSEWRVGDRLLRRG